MIAAPSPSGYEQPAQEIYRAYCHEFADEVRTDVLGNVYATVNPSGSPTVMLAGHIDEIGFHVSDIHHDGYIFFSPLGGHDAAVVIGQRVLVHTADHGALPGTVGRKPVHFLKKEERGKATELDDMIIDIGASADTNIHDLVRIGDPITFASPFEHLVGGLAVSHAFDNKTGAYVVAEALRLIKERGGCPAAVHSVSTVQEEVGLRGARTASYALRPQIGIAVDVCHASDYPGSGKKEGAEPLRCGGGPVIYRGANVNPEVFRRLVAAAEAEGIVYQVDTPRAGTGTDADIMQLNQGGMATGLISIPLRYMHTPGEVVALSDLAECSRLLARFIADIAPDTDFTPSMANWRPPDLPKHKRAARDNNETGFSERGDAE